MINKINARQSDQGNLYQDPNIDTPHCVVTIAGFTLNDRSDVEEGEQWNEHTCFVAAIVSRVGDFLDGTASRVLKQYLGDPE